MSGATEFKTSLEAFLRQDLTLDVLAERLDQLWSSFPDDCQSIVALIQDARTLELPSEIDEALGRLADRSARQARDRDKHRPAYERSPEEPSQVAQIIDTSPRVSGSSTPTDVENGRSPGHGSRHEANLSDTPTVMVGAPGEQPPKRTLPWVTNSSAQLQQPRGPGSQPLSDDPEATALAHQDIPTVLAERDHGMATDRSFAPPTEHPPFGMDLAPLAPATNRPDGQEDGSSETIGPGYVLKQRFELLSSLGEGGMGVVYKAIDRLKVEARDRNPYLAVKLLSGDFKAHPESFIALQREASKAQRLAHPNIATVYDFDRDGETIYMTMELLEGQPFNKFIRQLPAGGLPAEEAMDLITQLGAGLSYAHKHNLVHSDLKPGNCYVIKDGTLKLLDFGISRASQAKSDAEGETTVFDPGELGALTPAYATVEMFDGEPPDPRDDIYALACIAYELLAGKHPFNKLSAPRAMSKHLKPPATRKISKRQFRGLAHALAFRRQDRTPTVDQFLQEIRPRKSRAKQVVLGVVATLVVLALSAYPPVDSYLKNKRNAQLATAISHGSEHEIQAALKTIRDLDPGSRKAVLDETKNTIISLYEQRAEQAIETAAGRYDYPAAAAEIRDAMEFYPDSPRLLKIEADIEGRRNRLLNELNERFNEYLDSGRLLPVHGKGEITDVLQVLSRAAPDHPLLHDPRLPVRYAEEAEKAIQARDFKQAGVLLEVSAVYVADDLRLASLRFQVRQLLRHQQEQARVAEIEQRLRDEPRAQRTLAHFDGLRDDLVTLARLRPDSQVLSDLRQNLEDVFGEAVSQTVAVQAWDEGEALLLDFAKLMDIPYLTEQRRQLSAAQARANYVPADPRRRSAEIERRQGSVGTLVEQPAFTDEWETSLLLEYKDLIALLPPGDGWLEQTREQIAHLYLTRARGLRADNRFSEALAHIEKGLHVHPDLSELNAERMAIEAAEAAFQTAQQEKARLARLEGLKQTLLTQASANRVKAAKRSLEELRQVLPPSNTFLMKDGPEAIGQAYLRLAEGQASKERYETAVKLAEVGISIAPDLPPLQAAHTRYTREVELGRLHTTLRSAENLDAAKVDQQLADIRSAFPDRYPQLASELAGLLERRIETLKDTDVAAAGRLLATARQLFPEDEALSLIQLKLPSRGQAHGGSRTCQPDLAGYGTQSRATCYDMVAEKQKGPAMVVVPASGEVSKPYAIAKYETSIRDYNLYCAVSGQCQPVAGQNPELPVTGIMYRDAEAYAEWLSRRTRHTYRLPRDEEWVYAAMADGPPAKKDFNCRVQLGDQVLKGHAATTVRSGMPNGWGLTNHVGNVQEWVVTASGTAARGGSYHDSLSECDVSLSRDHDGTPDPMTGFRLVRELG